MLFVKLVDLLLPVVFDLLLHRDIAELLQLTLRVNIKLLGLFVLLLPLLHRVEHVCSPLVGFGCNVCELHSVGKRDDAGNRLLFHISVGLVVIRRQATQWAAPLLPKGFAEAWPMKRVTARQSCGVLT